MNIGRMYLLMEKRRINNLIYIKPGQRILAVRPPYQLPARRGRGLVIRVSIKDLREILAARS